MIVTISTTCGTLTPEQLAEMGDALVQLGWPVNLVYHDHCTDGQYKKAHERLRSLPETVEPNL